MSMTTTNHETVPSVASALLRAGKEEEKQLSGDCDQHGGGYGSFRWVNVVTAVCASLAIGVCLFMSIGKMRTNEVSIWNDAYQVATVAAQKCWSSERSATQLIKRGAMSPTAFSLEFPTSGERNSCNVLLARDATEDDCYLHVSAGGGNFRMLSSGLYLVTVQVVIEAEAASGGGIELIIVRKSSTSGKAASKKSSTKAGPYNERRCRRDYDGAAEETVLGATKFTLPISFSAAAGDDSLNSQQAAAAATRLANTTLYASKVAALRSGDEIVLQLNCFGNGIGNANDKKSDDCRLSLGRGSFLSLLPVELSENRG